jgi:hypothetical protein
MSAVVVGLCALSFAAGSVVTAAVLRRERTPVAAPEPVVWAPEPTADPGWPPEDYVTRPIHRNPVLGLPTALPAPSPGSARPALALVPDQGVDRLSEPEKPSPLDEVRHMHVVRDVPAPEVDGQADGQTDERPARRESNR